MAIIARLLVAQKAFIEALESRVVTLSNGGIIQSENFDPEQPVQQRQGFRIKHDGDAEFNDGKFRGHIDADSGTFRNGTFSGIEADGINISGDSTFSGKIDSGVLKVQPSQATPFSLAANSSDSAVSALANTIRNMLGLPPAAAFTVYPEPGATYYFTSSNLQNIKSIAFVPTIQTSSYSIEITASAGYTVNYSAARRALSFSIGVSGLTLRLEGLPTGTTVQNEVYKYFNPQDSRTYLVIKN